MLYYSIRHTRKYIQNWIKPGVKLIDMCEHLEETVRTLVEANKLEAGTLFYVAGVESLGRRLGEPWQTLHQQVNCPCEVYKSLLKVEVF